MCEQTVEVPVVWDGTDREIVLKGSEMWPRYKHEISWYQVSLDLQLTAHRSYPRVLVNMQGFPIDYHDSNWKNDP